MTVATAPTVTAGRLLLKSRDGSLKEWVSFTGVSGTTVTGLTRGLSQTADPATSGTGLTWVAGTQVILVAMHDQLGDKQEGYVPKQATTAALNARTSKTLGERFWDTTQGTDVRWTGAAYEAYGTASVTNATTTSAGKVELATSAESVAGTDNGSVGPLSVQPSLIAANVQSGTFVYAASTDVSDTYTVSLTPALTAYTTGMKVRVKFTTANTGACTLNINSLGAKNIKLIDGTDPLDGDIAAGKSYGLSYDGTNFILERSPAKASASEVNAGTSENSYVSPNILNDYYSLSERPYRSSVYDVSENVVIYSAASPYVTSGTISMDNTGIPYGITSSGSGAIGLNSLPGEKNVEVSAQFSNLTTIELEWVMSKALTNVYYTIGFIQTLSDAAGSGSLTNPGVAFYHDTSQNVHILSRDGSTSSTQAASGGTLDNNAHHWKLVYAVGSSATLYKDGTLVATKTTNLPTQTGTVKFAAGIQGANGIIKYDSFRIRMKYA